MKLMGPIDEFPYRGEAWLYGIGKYGQGERWFAVWEGRGPGNQNEALAFRCDEIGKVRDWHEVARQRDRDAVVAEVERIYGTATFGEGWPD